MPVSPVNSDTTSITLTIDGNTHQVVNIETRGDALAQFAPLFGGFANPTAPTAPALFPWLAQSPRSWSTSPQGWSFPTLPSLPASQGAMPTPQQAFLAGVLQGYTGCFNGSFNGSFNGILNGAFNGLPNTGFGSAPVNNQQLSQLMQAYYSHQFNNWLNQLNSGSYGSLADSLRALAQSYGSTPLPPALQALLQRCGISVPGSTPATGTTGTTGTTSTTGPSTRQIFRFDSLMDGDKLETGDLKTLGRILGRFGTRDEKLRFIKQWLRANGHDFPRGDSKAALKKFASLLFEKIMHGGSAQQTALNEGHQLIRAILGVGDSDTTPLHIVGYGQQEYHTLIDQYWGSGH